MNKVKIGIIGLGVRTETLLASILAMKDEVEVTAVCDLNPARIQKIFEIFDKHTMPRPKGYGNYHELLDDDCVEAVLVPTSWNSHIGIARDAMAKGKYAGIEVGGASSIEELWQLVHAAESTGVSCMMLENCCYGRNELMVLNMVRQGLFGELIYCEGGYEHDLTADYPMTNGMNERHLHNLHRNGELYPTHALGPLAKILRINRGNRFLSLTSSATKARGYANAWKKDRPGEPVPAFACGDIVTTVIKCANGENITLTHGISLPRPYSRNCRVQGDKGIWLENAKGIYIDGISPCYQELDPAGNPYYTHKWDKVEDFYDKYDHPIWKEFQKNVIGGHGGMDALALRAFFDAVRNRTATPIDVYDCAAWMAVTCLSEQSIALGSMPVPFPDFTNGKWVMPPSDKPNKWSLDEVYDL